MDLYNNYLLSDIKIKFERYIPLINEYADRLEKSVDVNITGDKILVDIKKYLNFINSSIHLFRNIIDHGIEKENERLLKNKPQKGVINFSFSQLKDSFQITLEDDGAGIDPKIIRKRLIQKGLKSLDFLEKVTDSQVLDFIFLPGFSTKDIVTDLSGRGVGLDAVREDVKTLGGKITVNSILDRGTIFTIIFPL